ncbi:UBA-like superfamily [Arabidopsis thaliana x Arabidopsis arenosa]|uniref:UBA-like superfamily n=2 Tax=Arabidopsis TaxID=3701 RepID=A0A8T1Z468_ARASU|nr:UBA-like superfamily [Arabidopsis thaliana x Arabidopsis arenosa]KAG7553860.1 UBA-like superfamily [Arabidopsis suecica]
MSTRVCGKRVGYDDFFGSSSSPTNKRSKWSSFGSPIRLSETGSESDDPVASLIHMFPSMDPEFVREVLSNKNYVFEEAKESLSSILFNGDSDRIEAGSFDGSVGSWRDEDMIDGAKWVDRLVSEMAKAINVDDMRRRVAVILEALERIIKKNTNVSNKLEYASLKESLQSLINDNQILKRVIANQHQRSSENEEKAKQVQHLKGVVGQYQEQVHKLELSNYAMKLHLQRSQQQQTSFSGNLPPDVY